MRTQGKILICIVLSSVAMFGHQQCVAATWTSIGSLNSAQGSPTATLLTNGLVLVVGGRFNSSSRPELYDPASRTWRFAGPMATTNRIASTATLLTNGKAAKT